MPAQRLGGRVEVPGVSGVDGDRLLAEYVGTGFHSSLGVLVVEHRRAPDHHRVQIQFQGVSVILGDVLEPEPVLQHLESIPTFPDSHHEFHVVPFLEDGNVVARRP